MKKLVILESEHCPRCRIVKQHLDRAGVTYEERVETGEGSVAELGSSLGHTSFPVTILYDGEDIVKHVSGVNMPVLNSLIDEVK